MRCNRDGIVFFLYFSFLSGVLCMTFTCHRPTTPCDMWYGTCSPNGKCDCSSGASGLRCDIPGHVKGNGGSCQTHNPCQTASSTCYDDAVLAKCDCIEGYYGDRCQHLMASAECDDKKMVINVLPYGYDVTTWGAIPPPETGTNLTCTMDKLRTFLMTFPSYNSRGWSGFAGVFDHIGDTCAGDAAVLVNTTVLTTYSRTVYIGYSALGPDVTDQTVELVCNVSKDPVTPPPAPLMPPVISIAFETPFGAPKTAPFRLGDKVHVHFTLNVPNSGGYDDAQVESCNLRDSSYMHNVTVVDQACAREPVGELLYKKGPGVAVLIMLVYTFPGHSNQLTFQCRVRLCDRNLDNYCSTPAQCYSRAKRSSVDRSTPDDHNVILVESSIIV